MLTILMWVGILFLGIFLGIALCIRALFTLFASLLMEKPIFKFGFWPVGKETIFDIYQIKKVINKDLRKNV